MSRFRFERVLSRICRSLPKLHVQGCIPHNPQGCTLAVTTGSGKVYLWAPGGASIVHIPLKAFCARSLAWNPRGTSLCLMDSGAFCMAYVANTAALGAA
jgi:hypothetical protein